VKALNDANRIRKARVVYDLLKEKNVQFPALLRLSVEIVDALHNYEKENSNVSGN
jgi:hypothetical protein